METILWTHHRCGSTTFIDKLAGNKKHKSGQELFAPPGYWNDFRVNGKVTMETILWTHHRCGSTTFIDKLAGNKTADHFDSAGYWNEYQKFPSNGQFDADAAYKQEIFGNYTFKIMTGHDMIEHAKYVVDNNIECNHVLLFRKNIHRAVLSYYFANVTAVWNTGDSFKWKASSLSKKFTDDKIQNLIDDYKCGLAQSGPQARIEDIRIKRRNKIWHVVRRFYEFIEILDCAYQILIDSGRRVRIGEYSDIYTEHETTGKFYNQLDAPGVKEALEPLFNNKQFYADYLSYK